MGTPRFTLLYPSPPLPLQPQSLRIMKPTILCNIFHGHYHNQKTSFWNVSAQNNIQGFIHEYERGQAKKCVIPFLVKILQFKASPLSYNVNQFLTPERRLW